MAVDFDSFVCWAEDRFNGDIVVANNEVKLNSVFTEDHKHHLWCNPDGGKHYREDGCYRCFYTENKGTLVGLVMLVDNCSYYEAKEILNGNSSGNLGELEEKLEEFFKTTQELKVVKKPKLDLPPYAEYISELPHSSWGRKKSIAYLEDRGFSSDGFLYCQDGDYKNRIIIPYYDKEGTLIYWNTRTIGKSKLRYMGPPKSVGIGKSDVLYVPRWPEKSGTKVYVTEGEFDALTLSICGFYSAACGGKSLSDKQLMMLKDYKVCLALDQDNAGFEALLTMGKKLISFGVKVSFIRPPVGFKDWNALMIALNSNKIVAGYIELHEKPFDQWEQDILEINKL